jgi:hypothetical protein
MSSIPKVRKKRRSKDERVFGFIPAAVAPQKRKSGVAPRVSADAQKSGSRARRVPDTAAACFCDVETVRFSEPVHPAKHLSTAQLFSAIADDPQPTGSGR